MPRQYYYNPDQGKSSSKHDKEFVLGDYFTYINSNPWLRCCLREAAKKYHVRITSLSAALSAIGLCTKGFSTTASQKTIAEKSGLSIRGLQTAIYALRKMKILTTKHRYTKDTNKRRTTSLTIVRAFIKFLDIQAYSKVKKANTALINKMKLARPTKVDKTTHDPGAAWNNSENFTVMVYS